MMDRHPNWRAAIGARVRCKGRGGKWTIMSRGNGKPPMVKVQEDVQPAIAALPKVSATLNSSQILVAVADLEPIWPPEPGMLVEVRADGPIGEVRYVTDGAGRVRVDVRMTDETLGTPGVVSPIESFDSEELAAL
jgi:hypothetical protein